MYTFYVVKSVKNSMTKILKGYIQILHRGNFACNTAMSFESLENDVFTKDNLFNLDSLLSDATGNLPVIF